MNLYELTELMLAKQKKLKQRETTDVCSACGYEYPLVDMVDITRLGYDPAMVYECVECTTREG